MFQLFWSPRHTRIFWLPKFTGLPFISGLRHPNMFQLSRCTPLQYGIHWPLCRVSHSTQWHNILFSQLRLGRHTPGNPKPFEVAEHL
jgi:hypothetical protein